MIAFWRSNGIHFMIHSGEAATTRPPSAPYRRAAVEQELKEVLESEFFSRSERARVFLRHVVETALSGRADELKERTLGVLVFGRDPAYDTGADAIVRVKANEVRRRLAQHNLQVRSSQIVRIDLPPGSYAPQFHWIAELPEKPARKRRFGPLASINAALAVLLFIAAFAYWHRPIPDPLSEFWQPVLASPKTVILCLGHPVVYFLSPRVHQRFKAKYGRNLDQGPYELKFEPQEVLGSDIISVPDQFVGIGDAQAAYRIASRLQGLGKQTEMRIGNDVSFSELRLSPAVFIGAYSNQWTMKISNQFRFVFDMQTERKRIVDRSSPGRSWSPPFMVPTGKVSEDYAIVSRAFHAESGQMMISAAGITGYGSQAAGEFLADSRLFEQVLKFAPPNWQRMNFQVVLKTKIFGSAPTPPEVVAAYFW